MVAAFSATFCSRRRAFWSIFALPTISSQSIPRVTILEERLTAQLGFQLVVLLFDLVKMLLDFGHVLHNIQVSVVSSVSTFIHTHRFCATKLQGDFLPLPFRLSLFRRQSTETRALLLQLFLQFLDHTLGIGKFLSRRSAGNPQSRFIHKCLTCSMSPLFRSPSRSLLA